MKLVKLIGRKPGQAYHEVEFDVMRPRYILGILNQIAGNTPPVHIFLVTNGENWVKDTGHDLEGIPTVFWCQRNDDVLLFGAYSRIDAEDLLKEAVDPKKANSKPDLRIEEFDVFVITLNRCLMQNMQFLVQYEPKNRSHP